MKEQNLIKNIVISYDWEEVINNIVIEEGIDPWDVDIIKLTEAFIKYLNTMKYFDFRIPARFILVAAILLRMKCELLLEEEETKESEEKDIEFLDINNIKLLDVPVKRKPKRKIILTELVSALEKAFELKKSKERKRLRMRKAVETLIEVEEDIEEIIDKVYENIRKKMIGNELKFSELVTEWKRETIVKTFMPLLHLTNRDKISCRQPEMFKEIFIRLK
ncbi:MAG: hypothetical protein DRO96_00260 [Candidatus Aenigmatarchaeota archaeon]|nr:MAG: hypothetical protein B6U68_02830 [Candidatus Aenigmarchaeota archaeon ex4484_14]RLF35830.1 MAG: hypothetical protein DRN08_02370 [Thermoplasmata archaeon]RLI97568.1 MAG: hypothetical protein DRO96_00260 [Candidatus Aenigmarchaeota archaeon]